jgi:hypothetical protein
LQQQLHVCAFTAFRQITAPYCWPGLDIANMLPGFLVCL